MKSLFIALGIITFATATYAEQNPRTEENLAVTCTQSWSHTGEIKDAKISLYGQDLEAAPYQIEITKEDGGLLTVQGTLTVQGSVDSLSLPDEARKAFEGASTHIAGMTPTAIVAFTDEEKSAPLAVFMGVMEDQSAMFYVDFGFYGFACY